jgi:hypothetical protein
VVRKRGFEPLRFCDRQPLKPATLKKDMDFVRLVLRHAKNIEKCLDEPPEFPAFRGQAWAVVASPRPFFDHDKWVALRTFAKKRISAGQPAHEAPRARAVLFSLISFGAAARR